MQPALMAAEMVQGKAVSGLYTAPYQYTCMSAYARARIGSTVTGDACPEPTAFANGSALVYFNSSSYYDDMLWAASWLYLATGAFRSCSNAFFQSESHASVVFCHDFAASYRLFLHSLDVWQAELDASAACRLSGWFLA